MDDWCTKHHGASGLTAAVKASRVTERDVETRALELLRRHVVAGKCPLAGNSVHADKAFLVKYMPEMMEYLHYRIVDVSTLKELCRRWFPAVFAGAPAKRLCHRAEDDIIESIAELSYYRAHMLGRGGAPPRRHAIGIASLCGMIAGVAVTCMFMRRR